MFALLAVVAAGAELAGWLFLSGAEHPDRQRMMMKRTINGKLFRIGISFCLRHRLG
jgi:hypothetical protein